jgi:predicted ATPase
MPITTHVLNRLTRRQVIEMVEWIMGHQVLPAEMVEQIVTKTDGIPLFVEELSKSVQESEWLKEQGEHDTLFASQLPPVLPVSLRDALMARLDRLLPMVKETAQLGATLGREFAYELLAAVSPWCDHALREALDDLVTAGLLFRRGTPPEATYFFKHALVQEAAYQSLLKSTRQQYHEQIAHILEETFVDFATSHPEMVAHHYSEAGMAELATPYWQRAGAQNSSRSAYPEAISYLNKGLSVLQTLPASPERARREMELYTTLAPALRVAKGPASLETERAYIQARKLCHQVGAVSPLLTMLEGLCSCYVVRGEYRNALELGEESLALAQRTQTPARLLDAYRSLGTILRFMGEFASARTYLEAGIALYDPQQHPELVRLHGMDLGVICGAVKAFIIWLLGYADQARQCLDEVLVLARQHAHPYSLAFVLNQAIDLFQLWEDLEQAQRHLELIQHIATTQGFPFWTMRSNLQQGVGAVLQGHEKKGISQLREGLAAQEKQRVGMGRTQWLVALAKAHGQAGQPKVGLEVLNDALTIAHTKAERYLEAEVHRLRGELLLQSSQAPERAAADCFQRALTLAQEQGAKVWELRAAISLSRLWQQQGHREDARELLGGVYHGFSEGFDTVDLQRAQALLARLA